MILIITLIFSFYLITNLLIIIIISLIYVFLLDAIKVVDDIYKVLPPHLHDRYSIHVKDKICEKQMVDICPTTAKITIQYLPIIVHAIKD